MVENSCVTLFKKALFPALWALCLLPAQLLGWTDGELLVWMDADRGRALKEIAQKFEDDFGIKATIETPENISTNFPLAAQAAKGPDVVIWAHDKVGEWADGGLIAPVELSSSLADQLFPKARQVVVHGSRMWGYPIALETVTLIYNRALLDGSVPTQLSELASINRNLNERHPGAMTILWDYKSAYYS